eukprot:888177-Amorphochlora_amoeboformis.AAC.2
MMSRSACATRVDVALLILQYLKREKFTATYKSFRSERLIFPKDRFSTRKALKNQVPCTLLSISAEVIKGVSARAMGRVRDLRLVLSEYMALKSQQAARQTFIESVPKSCPESYALKLWNLLDDYDALNPNERKNLPIPCISPPRRTPALPQSRRVTPTRRT